MGASCGLQPAQHKRQRKMDSCFHRQSFVLISWCAENEGGHSKEADVPTEHPS